MRIYTYILIFIFRSINEITMNASSVNTPVISSDYFYLSSNLIDNNINILDNQTLPLLQFNHEWIFPLFILSLFGILLTIIISFLYVYLSIYRLNHYLNLTNLFLCLSVCFIYIIVIFFLIRGNELFCGLREFLSQFAYALLYSSLLCRYIMQWLSSRILSKRTKQLTSLLIYSLLISIQIPIGILWWYFTIPRVCQQRTNNEYPKLKIDFEVQSSSIKPCSFQCTVDYRFYATYTYPIIELSLCTIISVCLFLCRHCYKYETQYETNQLIRRTKNVLMAFFNMFAFILIDIAWLIWTIIYHFTHPYFVFPSLVIGMFTIGTICLLFILVPTVISYSKVSMHKVSIPSAVIYTNQLAEMDDMKNQGIMFNSKQIDQNKSPIMSNDSELSYELGASGTFLPITKSPKGLYKAKVNETNTSKKRVHKDHSNIKQPSNYHTNDKAINTSIDKQDQLQSPISSNKSYDYSTPLSPREHISQPNSTNRTPSSYISPHHDEAIIPILCNSQSSQSSTPVKMHVLIKSPSSSVPLTRRVYSNNDQRHIRHPYYHVLPPLTPPITPIYYSPRIQREPYSMNPYRTVLSCSDENTGQSVLSSPYRYPHLHRRSQLDNRSLSQRLWDIDSGDDNDDVDGDDNDNEFHAHIRNIRGDLTPMKERLKDFHPSQIETNEPHMLHIDDDDDDDDDEGDHRRDTFYKKNLAFV